MKECPEFLLSRIHKLKIAAKEARQRSEEAGIALLNLRKQLDEANAHLDQTAVTGGEQRPEVGARVDKRRKELTEQIAKLTKEVETQKEISTRATEFAIATQAVYEKCSLWLDSSARGDTVYDDVRMATWDNPVQRLHKITDELSSLTAEGERIEAAPIARTDIDLAVRQYLDKLRAEPKITFENGTLEILMPGMKRQPQQAYFPTIPVTQKDLLALALWLNPEATEQKLLKVVDRIPAAVDALPNDVKRTKLRELRAKRDAALYELGALVRQAIEQGMPILISKELAVEHLLSVKSRAARETRIVTGKGGAALPAFTAG